MQIGTQNILTICQNNISYRALVASCGKINAIRESITNWGEIITNWAAPVVISWGNSYYKLGQFQLLQIGEKLLQIGAVITNQDRIITNQCRYYKLGQLS